MFNKYILASMLLTATIFVACEDDSDVAPPFQLVVAGDASVITGEEDEYTLGDVMNPDSYSWTVSGPAEIVGSSTGNTITVRYTNVGDVVISVTDGTYKGTQFVTVSEVEPMVDIDLGGTGVLRNGASDTVFFGFEAPLASAPSLRLIDADDSTGFNSGDPFVSGTLGELKQLANGTYYAVYTAGAGNGTTEVLLQDIVATDAFGGLDIDSLYMPIFEVDNITPIANVDYSTYQVNDSSEVTVTVTFSEEVMFADPADSALLVSFSGAGVKPETDTLEATGNPLVYEYTYTVNGESNGTLDVALSNIVDLAGNPLSNVEYAGTVTVDNEAPVMVIVAATDQGDYVKISASYIGASQVMYLVVDATDEDFEEPTTAEEFMDTEGVLAGTVNGSTTEILGKGKYTVYFLAVDAAGNYSSIAETSLTMD